jgi:hypothetical protein
MVKPYANGASARFMSVYILILTALGKDDNPEVGSSSLGLKKEQEETDPHCSFSINTTDATESNPSNFLQHKL